MKLLITGGGGPAAEALWDLWRNKFDLYFADQDINRIHPKVPRDKCLEIPNANSAEFLSAFERMVDLVGFECIVSQVDEELLKIKDLELTHRDFTVISPSADFIRLCLDKAKLGKSLTKAGINDPRTQILTPDSIYFGMPLLIKPQFGRGSRDIFVAKSNPEFIAIKKYLLTQNQQFVFQELILGQEYTVQMLANRKGKLRAIVPLLVNEKRGSTTSCEVSLNQIVINECQKVHACFKPAGTYNIQLLYSPIEEKAHIIEINPRVSTTMCLSVQLGFDPVDIFLNESTDFEIELPTQILKLNRYWTNEFSDS